MAFFNKILGLGLDEKKIVEVISTYDWRYGFILFNNETWGEFQKENVISYLRDHGIVSSMKKDSKLKEKDFIYLFVDWESVLDEFSQTPTGSTVLPNYDANEYNSEEEIENFYNSLTAQLQQQIVSLLKSKANVKQYSFSELH